MLSNQSSSISHAKQGVRITVVDKPPFRNIRETSSKRQTYALYIIGVVDAYQQDTSLLFILDI